jgi:hypothetical protein
VGTSPPKQVYHAGYLGQAGAFATHYRFPAGSQTYAQLTAERNNLIKARAAKGYYHKTSAAKSMARNFQNATFRGNLTRNHIYGEYYLSSIKQHAIGVRWMAFHQKAKIKKPSINGKYKKFRGDIGPGRYLQRTSWGTARKPGFRGIVSKRSKRFHHVHKWRGHGNKFVPL